MRKFDRKLPLGQQIALARQERGASMGQLEAKSEGRVNKSTLSRVESLVSDPTLQTLCVLADVLDAEFCVGPKNTAYITLL